MSGIYSDEDNDSVVSSHVSDVGSPSCSTLSPQVAHNPSLFLPDISAKHNNLVSYEHSGKRIICPHIYFFNVAHQVPYVIVKTLNCMASLHAILCMHEDLCLLMIVRLYSLIHPLYRVYFDIVCHHNCKYKSREISLLLKIQGVMHSLKYWFRETITPKWNHFYEAGNFELLLYVYWL